MRDEKLQFLKDRIIIGKDNIIMMDWERPLMKRHAKVICQNGGDILEIGFGMGISAQYIQEYDIDSHTIIEIHSEIAEKARKWAKDKENVEIIEADWYDVVSELKTYDGIFYDAERDDHKNEFYQIIKSSLKDSGVYTFFNPRGDGIKNNHSIKENVRYELIDIDPPENPYLKSNIYYLPIVKS
tara:strand:- start:173 stop:724 length:552 start_codon:yes stop_codon:yes gene_type:complete